MGIAGLFNSAMGLVSGATSFGLGSSAVKDIALAHGTGDESRVSKISIVLKRLILLLELLELYLLLYLHLGLVNLHLVVEILRQHLFGFHLQYFSLKFPLVK